MGPFSGCTDKVFNNFFIATECKITDGICNYLEKNPSTNKWADTIVTTEPFPKGAGLNMTRWVYHATPAPQIPTNELWQKYQVSHEGTPDLNPNDPGYEEPYNACLTECHTLGYGLEAKNWSMQRLCLATTWLCAQDLWSMTYVEELLAAQADNLARVSRTIKANWNRDKTLEYSQIVPLFQGYREVIDHIRAPKGCMPSIPPGGICCLSIEYFYHIYDALSRQFPESGIGSYGGQPVYGAIASAKAIFEMFRSDPEWIDLFKYDPAMSDFYRNGYNKGVGSNVFGFSFMYDPEAPRWNEDPNRPNQLVRVYPYEEGAASIGSRFDTPIGGSYDMAEYEAIIILFRDQFTNVPFDLPTNYGSGVNFGDVDYNGRVKWQRHRNCEDEDSLMGRFRMQWIMGTKPGCHDAGLAFLFKRCERSIPCSILTDDCDETESPDIVCEQGEDSTQLCVTPAVALDPAPVAGDVVYVSTADGSTLAAEALSNEGGKLCLQFVCPVDCGVGGGITGLTTTPDCIGVCGLHVDLEEFADGDATVLRTVIKFQLLAGNTLGDVTPGAMYTASFADGTSYTVVIGGGPGPNGEFTIVFDGDYSEDLVDSLSLGGLTCLSPTA